MSSKVEERQIREIEIEGEFLNHEDIKGELRAIGWPPREKGRFKLTWYREGHQPTEYELLVTGWFRNASGRNHVRYRLRPWRDGERPNSGKKSKTFLKKAA